MIGEAITVVVEGRADVPIAARLIGLAGLAMGPVYVQHGKANLDRKLPGFNAAAQFAPWLVLRDLDRDAACPPELLRELLPRPAPKMSFRLAVRSAEAWLLADAEALSRYLAVPQKLLPTSPDLLPEPKTFLAALAGRSRSRAIRQDMTAQPGAGSVTGPCYSGRIIEFASLHWRPAFAARRSPSLARCLAALKGWASK